MAKIDTLFMTKTAVNPTLWGRIHLYSPYVREYSPRGHPLHSEVKALPSVLFFNQAREIQKLGRNCSTQYTDVKNIQEPDDKREIFLSN